MHRGARTGLLAAVLAVVAVVPAGTVHAADPIVGAGSTFAEVALDQWSSDLARSDTLNVDYTGVGSVGGLSQFQQGLVDFAASDVAYPPETPIQRPYAYVPIVAGGIALPYRIIDAAGQAITTLRLSPRTIAGIFFNTITNWRDPQVLADNPELVDRLPDREVNLAVRSAGSGTTGALTDYLSTVAPDLWQDFLARSGARTFDNGNYIVDWPESSAQFFCHCYQWPGSSEIAGWIAQNVPASSGSIGYVETAYAIQLRLNVATVQNTAGNYRLPTARNVAVALLGAVARPDGTQDLAGAHTNSRPEAYPISSYTYLVLPTDLSNGFTAAKGETLSRYLIYSVTAGQGRASVLGYSPLPPNLVQAALDRTALVPGAVAAPPLGDWGRFYEQLAVDLPPEPNHTYVAQYADATFAKRHTQLHVAGGHIDDRGVTSEELTIDLAESSCAARTSTTTTLHITSSAADLPGVVVDARGGIAYLFGTFVMHGTRTITPAGRNCSTPDPAAATTTAIDVPITITVDWQNRPRSTPDVYGGAECGGDGVCSSRDASARATWTTPACT